MNDEHLLWIVVLGAPVLALTTAILIKIYGHTRLLLGIALLIIGGFTLLLGWILVALPREAGWRIITLFLTCLGVLGSGFIQFLRAGRKNDKIDVETKFPFVVDTESIDDEHLSGGD